MQKLIKRKLVFVLFLGFSLNVLGSDRVIHIPSQNNQSLENRLNLAFKKAKDIKNTVWVGYSIEVLTEHNIHINHHGTEYSDDPTLGELLTGEKVSKEITVKEAAKRALGHDKDKSGQKTNRSFGILFEVKGNARKIQDFSEVNIMDFDSHVKLNGQPLLWIGQVDPAESFPYLVDCFNEKNEGDIKEDLVSAISFHHDQKGMLPFLKKVIKSKEDDEIREQAVFWLSHQEGKVLDFLVDVAHNDRSEDVREHAVFAVSLVDGKEAEEALIGLAKKDKDPEIRKKAVFWLGQKASEKATKYLLDVVDNDPDTEVKEHAVFALSQMDTKESTRILMKIGKTHPNREVRKKAIFWLGQSDDPEALDYLISLVRELE